MLRIEPEEKASVLCCVRSQYLRRTHTHAHNTPTGRHAPVRMLKGALPPSLEAQAASARSELVRQRVEQKTRRWGQATGPQALVGRNGFGDHAALFFYSVLQGGGAAATALFSLDTLALARVLHALAVFVTCAGPTYDQPLARALLTLVGVTKLHEQAPQLCVMLRVGLSSTSCLDSVNLVTIL